MLNLSRGPEVQRLCCCVRIPIQSPIITRLPPASVCCTARPRRRGRNRGRHAATVLPCGSPTNRPPLLMPDSSTAPPVGTDAAADPSPSRGTAPEGSPPAPPEDSVDDFILDSGAAVHATARADLLSDPRPPEEGTVVRTRVGERLNSLKVGRVRRPRFDVPQVHLAPDLKNGCAAVVSVRQLARRGLAVTFDGETCSVTEQSTGAVVGVGRLREKDGFYHLDYLKVPQN